MAYVLPDSFYTFNSLHSNGPRWIDNKYPSKESNISGELDAEIRHKCS